MKKAMVLVLVFLLALMSFACTKVTETTTTGTSGSTSTTSGTTTAMTTSKDDDKPIKLIVPYFGMSDEELKAALAENEKAGLKEGKYARPAQETDMKFTNYMKENHPNYIIEYVDWGWGEQLDQKIRASILAGDPPSIIVGEVMAPSYALEDVLSPLPQDIVDSVYNSFLFYDKSDKPVLITTSTAIFHLYYNLDILEKCGYSEADVPKTWDEWKAISDDVTQKGEGEFWGGGINSNPNAAGSLYTTPFLRQLGVDWGTPDSAEILSDPRTIKAIQFIRDMNKNLAPGWGNSPSTSAHNIAWGEGKIAFFTDGTWRDWSNKKTGFKNGVADLPLPEGGVKANCAVGSVIIGVPKANPNQDACFDVVRALILPENTTGSISDNKVVPSKVVMDNDEIFEGKLQAFLDAREFYRKSNEPVPGLVTFIKNSNSIWEIINQNIIAASTMTDTPIEELIAQAQVDINNLLK